MSEFTNFLYVRAKAIMQGEKDARQLVKDVLAEGPERKDAYALVYQKGSRRFINKSNRESKELELWEEDVADGADVSEVLIEEIGDVFDLLPDLFFATVFACCYDGMTVKEAANVMGCSEGNIRYRLNYVKKCVQDVLGDMAFSIQIVCQAIDAWMLRYIEEAEDAAPTEWSSLVVPMPKKARKLLEKKELEAAAEVVEEAPEAEVEEAAEEELEEEPEAEEAVEEEPELEAAVEEVVEEEAEPEAEAEEVAEEEPELEAEVEEAAEEAPEAEPEAEEIVEEEAEPEAEVEEAAEEAPEVEPEAEEIVEKEAEPEAAEEALEEEPEAEEVVEEATEEEPEKEPEVEEVAEEEPEAESEAEEVVEEEKPRKKSVGSVISLIAIIVVLLGAGYYLARQHIEFPVDKQAEMEEDKLSNDLQEQEESQEQGVPQEPSAPQQPEEPVIDEPIVEEPAVDEPAVEEPEEKKEPEYLLANSDKKLISKEKLRKMTKKELRFARNEIYARYGVKFDDKELDEYFRSKSWYKPKMTLKKFYATLELSDIEEQNVARIAEVEREK